MAMITTTLIVTTVSIKTVNITTLGLTTLCIIHKNTTLSATSFPICWVPLCQVLLWHKVVAPLSMIISVQAPPIHEKWGKSEKCKSKSKILAAFSKSFFSTKLNFQSPRNDDLSDVEPDNDGNIRESSPEGSMTGQVRVKVSVAGESNLRHFFDHDLAK
jgi:hypothetical protein